MKTDKHIEIELSMQPDFDGKWILAVQGLC
jgi:hypothetical protein